MSGHHKHSIHRSPRKNPCHFFIRFPGRCQYISIDVDPTYFPTIDQLKQHLTNHFNLGESPNLHMIDDTGRSAIVEKISSIKNNSMIFVESIGMKLESVFPDFSAVYPDPPIDKVPQKYTLPKYIEIVRTVLSDFSQLESCLNRINTKNLNKVPPGEQAQVEKYTVQSLFTEDGGFSPVFMAVAKRMHIDIPENTNLGPSINPKNRK